MAMGTNGTATVTLPTDEQILITREFDAPKHLVKHGEDGAGFSPADAVPGSIDSQSSHLECQTLRGSWHECTALASTRRTDAVESRRHVRRGPGLEG